MLLVDQLCMQSPGWRWVGPPPANQKYTRTLLWPYLVLHNCVKANSLFTRGYMHVKYLQHSLICTQTSKLIWLDTTKHVSVSSLAWEHRSRSVTSIFDVIVQTEHPIWGGCESTRTWNAIWLGPDGLFFFPTYYSILLFLKVLPIILFYYSFHYTYYSH